MAVTQRDGRQFSVTAAARDGTTSVRPDRVSCGTSVDLGSQPGFGVTMTDEPVALGDYSYVAVAELANGAKSQPKANAVVAALDDVTPPVASTALEVGSWATGHRAVEVALRMSPIVTARLIQTRTPAERPSTWMTSGSSSLRAAMSCPLARRSRGSSTAAS
jgi:hypothetical protein